MPLHWDVQTKTNKSNSLLYKSIKLTNDGKNISYRTINKFFKHLVSEGYDKNKIYIKVMNPQHAFTIKGFDDDMCETLDEYYRNSVKDPSKFTNNFESVTFGIYKY